MDKSKKREMMAGVFIISGILLLLVLLFFLGLSDIFAHKVIMRTGFSESVQGLSRGSAVKYRGVQIGNVKDISILVEENIIQVDMEIDPKFFAVNRDGHIFPDREFYAFFRNEIKSKGLRARLEMLGITGMKFIDFDYFAQPDSPVPPAPRFTGSRGVMFIPGVTSQMKDIMGTLTMAVDRLSKIRFERISEQLENALTGLGQLLNSQEIRSTIAKINDTAENLEQSTRAISSVLSESRIQGVVNSLEQNLTALNELQKSILFISQEAKVPETTAVLRQSFEDFSESRKEFENSLLKLNQALESFRSLTNYLSTDPASLLRGKQKKPDTQ